MSTEIAIAIPTKETALTVYSADNGLDPYLQAIRAEIDSFTPDATTKKGRDAIASLAHKVARSKTALDNLGKELVADLKELPKKIDAERKRMRDTLDAWKDEARKPLTDWEEAEQARIDGHKAKIAEITALTVGHETALSANAALATAAGIKLGSHWQEFEGEAAIAKSNAITQLQEISATLQKREEEAAELDRLRKEAEARAQIEREERIAREAAERAKREAEEAAERQRKEAEAAEARRKAEAERAELELKLRAEQAEARARQAEADAKARAEQAAKAERDRIEAEAKAAEQERQAREANRAHCAKVNREALAALMAEGLSEEDGKKALKAIAAGRVPRVSISY